MEHKNKLMWAQLLITLAVLLFHTVSTTPAQTVPEIAEKALAATVYLEMQDSNGLPLGFGSGFFVKPNLIATNYHVIEGAARGTAKLVGKYTTYEIEGITATDKINDLALLKVTAYGIKPLLLGNSNQVKIGETIYVAGNPKGLEGTFSDGIISSRRVKHTKEHLQMTAPISPGSSGGPVLNSKGEVIGISFMTIESGQNLNFAIPSRDLKILLTQSGVAKPLSQDNHSISAETYFNWGNTKYDLGNYKGAITDYTKAVHLEPDSAIYFNRGLATDKLEQYLAAISDYDMAIQLKPDYAKAYHNRGITKAKLGKHFEAIADYDTAIQLKPDYAKAYHNRGTTKAESGKYFEAIADYDTVIRLKPNYADAYYSRGNAKYSLEQYPAAILDYDIAIRLKPDYADAYNNRGVAKAELGKHFEAIADYDMVIRLQPDHAGVYCIRGLSKQDLGQYSAAIQDYDMAIRLKPDYAGAYYSRGKAKINLGRTSEAKQDFRFALRLAEKIGDIRLKSAAEKELRLVNILLEKRK